MGFKKIFIGTLLTVLDFRILSFDILPDFIGYIIIFIGLSEIVHLNSKFSNARFISLILMVLSFSEVFHFANHFLYIPLLFILSRIFGIITVIIYIIYSYCLFIGIKENADKKNDVNLAKIANLSWILAIVSSLLGIITLVNPLFAFPFSFLETVTFVLQLITLSMAKSLMPN